MVHPAPRIMNAIEQNISKLYKSGRQPGSAVKEILHPNGQNNNQYPKTSIFLQIISVYEGIQTN